jgi:hypothetical protein
MAACAEFGANLTITKEEETSVDHIFWPLGAHAACVFDYFGWDGALRAYEEADGRVPIVNAVALLGRLQGLSVADAKSWIKSKCFEFEREYLRPKNDFF